MPSPLRACSAALLCLSAACANRPIVAISSHADFGRVDRVAVLGFNDFPRRAGSGETVASVFEKELLGAGYSVVERRRVSDVLKEQRLSLTGAVNPKTAKTLGQVLGVDAFVFGSVTSFRPARTERYTVRQEDVRHDPIFRRVVRQRRNPVTGEVTTVDEDDVVGYDTVRNVRQIPETRVIPAEVGIAARMVDVEHGQVLWVGSYTDTGYALDEATDDVAHEIMKAVRKTWPKYRAPKEKA